MWVFRTPLALVGVSWDSWGAAEVCGDVSVTMRTLLGDIRGAVFSEHFWVLWGNPRIWGIPSGSVGISGIVAALPGIVGTSEGL